MADVVLVLKANNSDQINKMKESQKETQKVYDIAEKGAKREKGLIQDIEEEMSRLQKARQKAFTVEDIAKYNQKLAEAKNDLQQYEQAGLKAQKQTESLTQSIGKWALALGGAAAIGKVLKDALMKLTDVINVTKLAGAAYEQVLHNIVTGQASWIQGVGEAIRIQKEFNDLRVEGYKIHYEAQKLETKFQRLWSESLDAELSKKEKIQKIEEALAAKNEEVDLKRSHALREYSLNLDKILNQQGTEENVKAMWEAKAELDRIDAERYSSTKRLTRQLGTLKKEEHDDRLKAWSDEIEGQNKINQEKWDQEKQFLDASKKLQDDYYKSNIESLSGVEKLKAQRDFGVKQIKEMRDQMMKLGTLNDEQMGMLQGLADNVWKAYYKGLAEEAKKGNTKISEEDKKAISKALLGGLPELEGLQKSTLKGPIIGGAPKEFSIWSLIGIEDPESEEGKKQIEGLTEAKDKVISVIDEINQKRVDDTQRRRELLDTQISETQQALETEVQLYNSGYASNVAAKKKQLEELKKQRAAALKEEEEALKRQRQMDTITQVSALITASAQTFKSFPGPLLPVAIAIVAAMFAAFAATKVRAAAATKLAEGGSGSDTGVITGRSHASGGERFLDHVEVERGEQWGVLSIPATQKFGKVFHHIVSSFNKGEVPVMPVNRISNSVLVENSGPNSRLDQVVAEQRKLNARLSGDSIQDLGNIKIVRKGQNVKIISR